MEKARDLLSASLLSVKQIMAIAGYANTSNLSVISEDTLLTRLPNIDNAPTTPPSRRRIGIMTSK